MKTTIYDMAVCGDFAGPIRSLSSRRRKSKRKISTRSTTDSSIRRNKDVDILLTPPSPKLDLQTAADAIESEILHRLASNAERKSGGPSEDDRNGTPCSSMPLHISKVRSEFTEGSPFELYAAVSFFASDVTCSSIPSNLYNFDVYTGSQRAAAGSDDREPNGEEAYPASSFPRRTNIFDHTVFGFSEGVCLEPPFKEQVAAAIHVKDEVYSQPMDDVLDLIGATLTKLGFASKAGDWDGMGTPFSSVDARLHYSCSTLTLVF